MTIKKIEKAAELSQQHYRYYDFIMAATCVVIVCSNIIGAAKVATVAGVTFGADHVLCCVEFYLARIQFSLRVF